MSSAIEMPLPILRSAVQAWPFANGQGRIVDTLSPHVRFPTGRVKCRTRHGFDIEVMGSDHIGRHLLLSGQFDSSAALELIKFGEPGDSILDIGANIGYVSCLLLSRIPESRVTAIEPQPMVSKLLRHNLEQFPPARFHVETIALSDSDGNAALYLDPVNMGASSLHSQSATAVDVELRSTQGFLERFEKLDLVKIDVEGHEEAIIRSGADELRRLQPKAILFEDHGKKASPTGAIGGLLVACGYNIYGVRKGLMKTSLVPIRNDADCRYNDYLAVSRQRNLLNLA
jgi:FkbM family methyltransferase